MKQTIMYMNNTTPSQMEQDKAPNIEKIVLRMKEEFQIQTKEKDKEWERRLGEQELNDERWDRRIKHQHTMTIKAVSSMMDQFASLIESKENIKFSTKRTLDKHIGEIEDSSVEMEK